LFQLSAAQPGVDKGGDLKPGSQFAALCGLAGAPERLEDDRELIGSVDDPLNGAIDLGPKTAVRARQLRIRTSPAPRSVPRARLA